MPYTEANYENAIIDLFQNRLGNNYIYAPDYVRDYSNPLYEDMLISCFTRINKKLPQDAIKLSQIEMI